MNVPAVSVVTTVYNGQRYVEATVRSILAQTHRDFEYVIVDDGSTDQTPAILARLAAEDDRIRVIRQPNAGISRAANAGLAASVAPLVARIDSDDLAHPRRLAEQVAFLRDHEALCVGTFVEYVDQWERPLTVIACPTEDAEIQQRLLEGHCAIWNTSVMFRREAVERLGGYALDLDPAEDLDLWLRLGEIGTLANLPRPLMRYRLHPGSISETKRERQLRCIREAVRRAYERRGIDRPVSIPGGWRPDQTAASQHAFALKYGWWAYNSGHRRTAMWYGRRAIRLNPFDPAGWKLLAIAAVRSGGGTATVDATGATS